MPEMAEFCLAVVFPSLPRTTRGSAVVLGTNASGDKIQFCNGTSVYTVPFDDPKSAEIYTEHSHQTTVAKMSPSGSYCASGDANGKIRIWNTENRMLKQAISVFTGPVRDIAWCPESKRIAVVGGEGKDCSARVFLLDTGTSAGNLTGQTRALNSVHFKPTRPFRVISGSDDNSVAIFAGPPFKFQNSSHNHSKFVHSTRYNSDGSLFASAGGDGTIVVYNGLDGAKVGVLEDESIKGSVAHVGTVFGIAWSTDGSKIASASADKTVKIWDSASKRLENSILIGSTVADQQLGVIWTGKSLVSVSASGFLNFLDPENGCIRETRYGHNKGITTLATSYDNKTLFSSDAEGRIISWDVATAKSKQLLPDLHKSMITGMCVTEKDDLVTVSWDDHLRFTPQRADSSQVVSCKLPSQPQGLAVSSDGEVAVVACDKHLAIYTDGTLTEIPTGYNSSCVALSSDKKLLAVGGQDSNVHVYELVGKTLSEVEKISHSAPITSISFSDNGEFLVATDQTRKVVLYSVLENFKPLFSNSWCFHTAKVISVAWSPDNTRIATGSLDTNLIIWDIKNPSEQPIIIKGAHAMSSINAVRWLNETTIASAGQDANIKLWNVRMR